MVLNVSVLCQSPEEYSQIDNFHIECRYNSSVEQVLFCVVSIVCVGFLAWYFYDSHFRPIEFQPVWIARVMPASLIVFISMNCNVAGKTLPMATSARFCPCVLDRDLFDAPLLC